MCPSPRSARIATALSLALYAALAASEASAQSQAALPASLAPDVATARQGYPELIEYGTRAGGLVITDVNPEALAEVLEALAAGVFTPQLEAALRVIFRGMARQVGAVAVVGRNIMQDAAGAAATGGHTEAVRGVTRLLFGVMEDSGNPYSLLAEELLKETMRCGAAAAGDEALVREIAARINPDQALALDRTDGTLGDRYGLHERADLFTVIAEGARVLATGTFGTIVLSRDAGASWETPQTGTDEPLYAAAYGPGEEIWVVGRRGVVLHSNDGGRRFARSPTPFDRAFFGVLPVAPQEALVTGDFGLQLVRDADAGVWRCVPREQDLVLGRIVAAGSDAAMVAEFGTIERLPGGRLPGRAGALTGVPEDIYLFDLWFDARGQVGIAVGLAGTVLRTEDGGDHWAPVAANLEADLYGVGGSGDRVVVVGERGVVAISDDRGISFAPRDALALKVPFHDVALGDPENGYLVGPRGLIVALREGGRRFEVVRAPGLLGEPERGEEHASGSSP